MHRHATVERRGMHMVCGASMLCPWYATRKASKRQCSPVAVPSRVAPCVNENSTVIRCVSRSSSCIMIVSCASLPGRAHPRDPLPDAMPERMPHPHGPITVCSVDFARFRLPSVGSRGCALLSHVGGRCTVARWRVPQTIARITERISIPSHLRQVSTSWQAALNARKGS